jgi:hypothetical protein
MDCVALAVGADLVACLFTAYYPLYSSIHYCGCAKVVDQLLEV